MFASILPSSEDSSKVLPGDTLLKDPKTIIDSAFDLPSPPQEVFPWFVQLGKQRAGWYLPKNIERFLPRSRRALRQIDTELQRLEVGQRIPDYGGKKGYFDCFHLEKNRAIGYRSDRGRLSMTWVLTFWKVGNCTRVIIRLSIKTPRRQPSFLMRVGQLFDRITIAGLAAGLRDRV